MGSKTESVAHILIPQLKHELQADILDKIEKKTLTEQHVALAPMISFGYAKHIAHNIYLNF